MRASASADGCPDRLGQRLHDGEAEAAAGMALVAVEPAESGEDERPVLGRDAGAVVLDHDQRAVLLRP